MLAEEGVADLKAIDMKKILNRASKYLPADFVVIDLQVEVPALGFSIVNEFAQNVLHARVEQIDDRLEQRTVIDPRLGLQRVPAVIEPRGKQQWPEEDGGNQQELQAPSRALWIVHCPCPRLRKFQASRPASTTAIANH